MIYTPIYRTLNSFLYFTCEIWSLKYFFIPLQKKAKIDNTLSHLVYRDGQAVLLAKKEYDLLLYLIRNPHIALYRETIFEQVWQEPYYANTRTIDLHIQRLKKKLCLAEAIETVYKVGYRFWPEKVQ